VHRKLLGQDMDLKELFGEIRSCTYCAKNLPLGPRPIIRGLASAKIVIIGQAPGTKVHASGIPWDDASGKRLHEWMGITSEIFYDESKIAIVPMGFCYPGQGKSGDLPPRHECAPLWHERVFKLLQNVKLTILIGQYAQQRYLGEKRRENLTETVRHWRDYSESGYLPLVHPSPRNGIWLRRNAWFEQDVVPYLKKQIEKYT
jgi:uracil-DNA glycosylase family 4